MKGSLLILGIFFLGLSMGYFHFSPAIMDSSDISTYVLYAMMLLVGFSVGSDNHLREQFRLINWSILIVPCTVIIGTALGMACYHLLFDYPRLSELYVSGFGLGYYSLSSIIISKESGETIGIIALLANIIREIITLVCTPLFVRFFGNLSPIAAAGATSSDTTLPVILKFSGKAYVFISVINGIVLTLLVPVIISFIYWLF